MKALSIRNLPDDGYEALKAMAAANHRSMQEQDSRSDSDAAYPPLRARQPAFTGLRPGRGAWLGCLRRPYLALAERHNARLITNDNALNKAACDIGLA